MNFSTNYFCSCSQCSNCFSNWLIQLFKDSISCCLSFKSISTFYPFAIYSISEVICLIIIQSSSFSYLNPSDFSDSASRINESSSSSKLRSRNGFHDLVIFGYFTSLILLFEIYSSFQTISLCKLITHSHNSQTSFSTPTDLALNSISCLPLSSTISHSNCHKRSLDSTSLCFHYSSSFD